VAILRTVVEEVASLSEVSDIGGSAPSGSRRRRIAGTTEAPALDRIEESREITGARYAAPGSTRRPTARSAIFPAGAASSGC
jgi:hypothetical protein